MLIHGAVFILLRPDGQFVGSECVLFLIGQVVLNRRDHANLLDLGIVGITRFNGKLTLRSLADFTQCAARVIGELQANFTCSSGGLFDHVGFDFIQPDEQVLHLVLIGITGKHNALLTQIDQTAHGITHTFNVSRVNRYCLCSEVTKFRRPVVSPLLGGLIGNQGHGKRNFRCFNTCIHKVSANLTSALFQCGIQIRQVIADRGELTVYMQTKP